MIKINPRSISRYITLLMITFHTLLSAQIDGLRVDLRTDANTYIHPEAEAYKEKIIRNLQAHLGKYNDAAFLLDIDEGTVNAKSIETFQSLFHSNARVFNDLELYGTQIPIDEYVGIVAERMSSKGVEFKITDMLLKRVDNNPAFPNELFFEAKVMVNKLLLSRLDEKYKQVNIPNGGDVVTQEFTIIIQGADLEQVQIYGINGQTRVRPKPYHHEVRVAASYGIDINSRFKLHDNFAGEFSPDIKAVSMIDANFAYARSFKRGGHGKWLIGFGYGQHKWDVTTSEGADGSNIYSTSSGNNATNTLRFSTSYNYTGIKNQVSFTYFQGMAGIQLPLRKISGYKMEYWIEGAVLPTFITKKETVPSSDIKELSVVTFDGNDDPYCDASFLVPDGSFGEASSTMSIGFQIKPYIRYYLNESNTTGLTVGVGYSYYLQSWLDPNTASIHSNPETAQPRSLILNQLTPAHLRFELGLTFKLNK